MPRPRIRRDSGFTLVEMLVVMGVFGLLMVITFTILLQFMFQAQDAQARALALQDMRLGVSQIDRQVRSGNVIRDPATEVAGVAGISVGPFYSMRIFTQEGGEPRCAQWRVIDHDDDGFGDLEFRSWDPGYPGVLDVDDWGAVAHNIVDVGVHPTSTSQIDRNDPATWPPFWVDTAVGSRTQAQFVRITLRLKAPGQREDTKPVSVTTVVTGRNTIFGYPSSTCGVVPPA